MTSVLLGISFIGLFGYGYWLMTRLDHYEDRNNRRQASRVFRD